jgi:hypothetical protein
MLLKVASARKPLRRCSRIEGPSGGVAILVVSWGAGPATTEVDNGIAARGDVLIMAYGSGIVRD